MSASQLDHGEGLSQLAAQSEFPFE